MYHWQTPLPLHSYANADVNRPRPNAIIIIHYFVPHSFHIPRPLFLCLSSTSQHVNTALNGLLHGKCTLLDDGRQRLLPSPFLPGVNIRVVQDLVDVDLADAVADALLEDLLCERIRAVQDQLHPVAHGLVDRVQTLVLELDAARAVVAVHVAERGRQPVDARGHELLGLVGRRQQALEVRRVAHAVLAALDAARLGLGRDAARAAVGHELARESQVLGLLVVRHVDHDAVEAAQVGRAPHDLGRLRVVEVHGDGHGGVARGFGGQVHEQPVRVLNRPREEQDHGGGLLSFGGTHGG